MTRDGDKKFVTVEFYVKTCNQESLGQLLVTGYTSTLPGSEPSFVLPRGSGVAMAEWGSVGQIYMQSC